MPVRGGGVEGGVSIINTINRLKVGSDLGDAQPATSAYKIPPEGGSRAKGGKKPLCNDSD